MTSNGWPSVPLGEVLRRSAEIVAIDPQRRYQHVTVRLWGKGVVPRGEIDGLQIVGATRFSVRAGQFILSRIDARNGAFGVVPDGLHGAVATNDFPLFDVDQERLRPGFLGWLSRTPGFVELCRAASEGTTNRVRLQEDRFLQMPIPLPSRANQDQIVARLDALAGKVEEARRLHTQIEKESAALLHGAFSRAIEAAPPRKMADVAPLVRRPVDVRMGGEYPELGIRSFGKGTFHKPALDFLTVGTKSLYGIAPGDLVFNNVFAWEGAIAVAQPDDAGRVGSHRFITCVPTAGVVTADFLCFYFLTREGLAKIGEASPGGAGRNRTLGLEKFAAIEVPTPAYPKQVWFDRLQTQVRAMRSRFADVAAELDALMPAALDRAFRGEFPAVPAAPSAVIPAVMADAGAGVVSHNRGRA